MVAQTATAGVSRSCIAAVGETSKVYVTSAVVVVVVVVLVVVLDMELEVVEVVDVVM